MANHGSHQGIELLDHCTEAMIKGLRICALAEITGRRSASQMLDGVMQAHQVGLHPIHVGTECCHLARQARHVLAQVAFGVSRHQVRQFVLCTHMHRYQHVGLLDHARELAGKSVESIRQSIAPAACCRSISDCA